MGILNVCAGVRGEDASASAWPSSWGAVWAAYIGLQEAIFNKSTGKVILKTFSLYKKLLTLLRAGHDQGKSGELVWMVHLLRE